MSTARPSEYDKHADEFLASHGITFTAKLSRRGPMPFDQPDTHRDIYECTFTREGDKPLVVVFGQSLARSKDFIQQERKALETRGFRPSEIDARLTARGYVVQPPTAYDVLACLTKSNPGSFEQWCDEYGYNTDSRRAHAIWTNCHDEYARVTRFFTSEEMSIIEEIS